MKKHLTTILLFILFTLTKSYCQSNSGSTFLGYYNDATGQRIFDYCDFDYEPQKPLKISKTMGDGYTPAHYYDLQNNRVDGYIDYNLLGMPMFKTNPGAKATAIRLSNARCFVLGKDSFVSIRNPGLFILTADLDDKIFAEVIEKAEDITFYKFTRSNEINYMYKTDSSDKVQLFPSGLGFKKAAQKVFGESQALKNKIEKGIYGFYDIPQMAKILKYKKIFDKNEHIFFNKYWDEIETNQDGSFYCKIISINDSIFRMKYFAMDNTPIYEGYFTSFYPHNKTGAFNWFYSNGEIRKTIIYKNNEPTNISIFYKNGQIHYNMGIVDEEIVYNKVYDPSGKELINKTGFGSEVYFDSLTNRKISYIYNAQKLKTAFYTDSSNKKIYLYCDENARIRKLELKSDDYPNNFVKDFHHGIMLVKCIIDATGQLSDVKILKGIDEECDKIVLQAFRQAASNASFVSAKMKTEKVTQELIIPIDCNLQAFSIYRNHYNQFYYHNRDFMNQQRYLNSNMDAVKKQIQTSGYGR